MTTRRRYSFLTSISKAPILKNFVKKKIKKKSIATSTIDIEDNQPSTSGIQMVEKHQKIAMTNEDRHRINLMFHIIVYHKEELRLLEKHSYNCCRRSCTSDGCDSGSTSDTLDLDYRGHRKSLCHEEDSGTDCSCGDDDCKRFKHERRTDRWNQEFDEEYMEKVGNVDRNYHPKLCRVK